MTTQVMFGPALPARRGTLSASSASPESASSSESPRTLSTSNGISFSVRSYSNDNLDDIVPKIEELDDDDDDVKLSPMIEDPSPISPTSVTIPKRPRGRPRKHPLPPPTTISRPPKGRSKTGCITCRRRKKKCDETKPFCIHCQKNNVHCEGYPPKEYWKSGKQRQAEARRVSFDKPRDLPLLIEGVETEVDRHFLDHFNYNVSRVLSLFTDSQNPFKEILLPMAMRHRGLMHSLLCLSGSHLVARDPQPSFHERQLHHFESALQVLQKDDNIRKRAGGDTTAIIEDPTVAQTLVLCLKSICAGEVNGEYRPHLDAAKHLLETQTSPNQDFQNFLIEFFIYHDVANSITSLDRQNIFMLDDFQLPTFLQPEAGALLGVLDGLFGYISKIRQLRDQIRFRKTQNLKPMVDYQILSNAQAIDTALREWVCPNHPDEHRHIASLLYRQATWLYLHRTILPSQPSEGLRNAVDEGLSYVAQLPADSSTQSILLMPVFLLGCSAFEDYQRPPIRDAFEALQKYSSLGNIKYASVIVEKIWGMMDANDEDSWDWETVFQREGWDFLVT